jgi:hypothetical protein
VRVKEGLAVWTWLQGLSGGAATFVGSLTGSALGLIALLIGALFNAHLNRRRDDRLRDEERKGVVRGLRAELARIRVSLMRNIEDLAQPKNDFNIPDIAHSVRVMPGLLPRINLLIADSIGEVIDAYVSIDQYCDGLIMMGGHLVKENRSDRRLVGMPMQSASNVAQMSRQLVDLIDIAIVALDRHT